MYERFIQGNECSDEVRKAFGIPNCLPESESVPSELPALDQVLPLNAARILLTNQSRSTRTTN